MAIHCDDLNLLYLCTAKTGSTSVSSALIDQLGGRWVPRDHIWDGDRILVDFKHSSLQDLVDVDLFDRAAFESMHVALTVRNPFAWVLSDYRYRQRVVREAQDLGAATPNWIRSRQDLVERAADVSFDEFVRNELTGRTDSMFGRYVEGFRDLPSLTYLKIESIDADFNALLSGLGVGWHLSFPHDNATSGPGYRSVYSDEGRALVEAAFADDLAMFDYRF